MAKKNEEVKDETVKIEQPITPTVEVAPKEAEEPKEREATKEEVDETTKIQKLADEVERGAHGSGRERMLVLGADYVKVQAEVNRRARQ